MLGGVGFVAGWEYWGLFRSCFRVVESRVFRFFVDILNKVIMVLIILVLLLLLLLMLLFV